MAESMNISIEIAGREIAVGKITGSSSKDAVFTYSKGYVDSGFRPISIALPLQKEPFSPQRTRNFFEGLLPEGFARKTVSEWLHASQEDYLSILRALGEECLGAIRVSGSEQRQGGYEELPMDRVRALAKEGISHSTDMVVKAHLSLAGASGKVGLYYDESADLWYLPLGTAPSTHIVKQSHIRLGSIVTNEQLAMMTARALGIEVPESFIINMGQGQDEEVLFATRRYDRVIPERPDAIDGLPRPRRLHQEDFAQALGIGGQEKYESQGQGYLKQLFGMIRANCTDPISDQRKLWDLMIYDYLIGNTDNHIKNISMIYDADMSGIHMAPAYDIVSTCVYPQSSRQMGIFIGEEANLDMIGREHFASAAQEAGLGRRMAMDRFDTMADGFEEALRESARELADLGFENAVRISEMVLNAGGYGRL